MLEPDAMSKFWPPLVREVIDCVEHPGYRYEFFKTFAELDDYFTGLCGEDWIKQPWAEFWLGQHNLTRAAFRRELAARRGEKNGYGAYSKLDNKTFLMLAEKARAAGVRFSKRSLCRYIRECGYEASFTTVWRLMVKNNLVTDAKG